jgi:mono/diheme cytochrome c family protein
MLRTAVLMVALASVAGAHDIITTNITWTKEISRLLYKRCATCHGDNASIPSMGGGALMTYEQARPWAKDIKEEVLERRMPPWGAVKGFGEFKDDRGMTQEDMELISAWVEGGAPEGNPKFLPDKPKPGKWLDPAAPAGAAEIEKGAGERLSGSENVLAVRPEGLKKGASVQILASRPDGTFEPLLWIYKFNPDFARTYYYESPIALPAGTRIEMSPPDAGKIALFAKHSPSKLKSSTGGGR